MAANSQGLKVAAQMSAEPRPEEFAFNRQMGMEYGGLGRRTQCPRGILPALQRLIQRERNHTDCLGPALNPRS